MSIADRYWSKFYSNRDRNDNIKTKIDIKDIRGEITIVKSNKNNSSLKDKIEQLFKERKLWA